LSVSLSHNPKFLCQTKLFDVGKMVLAQELSILAQEIVALAQELSVLAQEIGEMAQELSVLAQEKGSPSSHLNQK